MLIHRVTVKNYRVHRHLDLDLDRGLNLLGGPNEAGKSTLMEAAHRGLFLRASFTGQLRDQMLPRAGGGHPEVTLEFEAEGESWILHKVFSGQNGITTLTRRGGHSLRGDAAEVRLGELLGGEPSAGGRGAANELPERWRHLWVRQGMAGDSPTDAVQNQGAALIRRLQELGGAGVFMSDLDGRIAGRVERDWEGTFTSTGKVSKGSRLGRLNEDYEEAERHLQEQERVVRERSDLTRTVEEATDFLATADGQRERMEEDLQEVEERCRRVEEHRASLQAQAKDLEELEKKLKSREEADQAIRTLANQLGALGKRLYPLQERAERVRVELKDQVDVGVDARRRMERQADRAREARSKTALARSTENLVKALSNRARLEEELERRAKLQSQVADRKAELALLPPVDDSTLQRLEGMDRRERDARAALDATAASVELLWSSTQVALDGEPLPHGEIRVLTDEGELEVGEVARLRIRPGGGRSLSEAREEVREAEDALRDELASVGARTLEEARKAHREAAGLGSRIRLLEDQLREAGGDTLEARRLSLDGAVADAKRDLRARGGDPDGPLPLEDEARSALRHAEGAEKDLSGEEESATEIYRAAEDRVTDLRKHLADAEDEARALERELPTLEARLEGRQEAEGNEAVRGARIQELRKAIRVARTEMEEGEALLREMDPEQLEHDRARLSRSLKYHADTRKEQEERRQQALGALRFTGGEDPHAMLDRERARLKEAERKRTAAQEEADALDLLHQEFGRARSELGTALSKPLAERVDRYLKLIFGPNASSYLEMNGTDLAEPGLVRDENFSFSDLSVGAQEQFAAAFRLATAEILSEPFGGTLPVVLDDAFANSDDDRIQGLARALDLAARNGLQVLLLSCRPEAWNHLGVRQVVIQARAETDEGGGG